MGISLEEVKQMVLNSIEESEDMNELIQTTINKIYEKGFDDGRSKRTQYLQMMDSVKGGNA